MLYSFGACLLKKLTSKAVADRTCQLGSGLSAPRPEGDEKLRTGSELRAESLRHKSSISQGDF